MDLRDVEAGGRGAVGGKGGQNILRLVGQEQLGDIKRCLLYTSDAADE